MMKVFEAFAGIGTQRMALRNLGIEHEVVAIAEIDKYAIKSYEAIHGEVNNLGDISKIEIEDIPDHDLFTYSFPCFTKDNLVLTEEGYKTINEVVIGDKVLTHNNTYEKVVKTFDNGIQPTVKVKAMGIDEIVTTPNHKFYVREKYREWNDERRSYDRLFKEPQWKEIKDVTKDYYLGMAVNQKSETPKWNGITFRWGDGRKPRHKNELQELMDNQDFWWIVGRYLADGWTRTHGGIVFGIGKNKAIEFENRLGKLFNYSKVEEKTVVKYHVPLKELSKFVEQFGKGAANKKLSKSVLNLPTDLLESFLDGYFSGNGSFVNGYWKANSVSRELMLGIGQAVMKVYKRPYSLHKDIRPKTAVIEGRTVNQKDTYSLSFKKEAKNQDNAFYENGYVWVPFNTIEDAGDENVYDIEVDNAHSFTVQNIIVHNCQDISLAGKGLGLDAGSGTRSGLLWECQKIIAGKKPKYLLLENVKNLVGKKHKHNFELWLDWLSEQGYKNYWKVLNAKDYGIPQNRERVFCISILNDTQGYEFPEPVDLEIRLKDLLEDEVDEKFYLSQEQVDRIKFSGFNQNKRRIQEKDYSDTLCARDYKDPKCVRVEQVGQYDTPTRQNSNRFRVYDDESLSPSLTTMGGGNLEPHIVDKKVFEQRSDEGARFFNGEYVGTIRTKDSGGDKRVMIKNGTKKGYIEATDGDGIDLAFPDSNTRRGRVQKQMIQTLDTGDNKGVIVGSTQKNAAVNKDGISPTLTAAMGQGGGRVPMHDYDFRVRKLTPLECWRLMGVDDSDFYKTQKVNSNTQLYKQAGNAIVVDVLEAIFRNLFLKGDKQELGY